MREERKFDSVEQLREHIARDIDAAKAWLGQHR
ncbi:MAG: riboflavin kinase [Pseudomonadota bacterium]